MANTQTTVPLFVANQVLTAAQQNASAGTGVPVFATTVTRDAAFGGSNKALAEGQLAYIEASNVVQYYDGAAWATVGPASANGLVFLGSTTAAASASINLDSVFSATYQNYFVQVCNFSASVGDLWAIRLRASGSTITALNYSQSAITTQNSSATIYDRRSTNTSYWFGDYLDTSAALPTNIQFWVSNPFATQITRGNINSAGGTNADFRQTAGAFSYNASTSADGIALVPYTSGTLSATIRVYGIANS